MAPALPLDAFHAYAYGTGFWYATRALARIYDPHMVYNWFSNERLDQDPSSIELYNIRTDALGLALLALFVVLLPSIASGHPALFSSRSVAASSQTAALARIGILGSMAHHASTGAFAYLQWIEPKTATGAMLLGWTVSAGLTALGAAAYYGVGDGMKLGGSTPRKSGRPRKIH